MEMSCFDPEDFCTDEYHDQLKRQESKLLQLYTEVMGMWKRFMEKATDWNLTIMETNDFINEEFDHVKETSVWKNHLNISACPQFSNVHFDAEEYKENRGCNWGSTYLGKLEYLVGTVTTNQSTESKILYLTRSKAQLGINLPKKS